MRSGVSGASGVSGVSTQPDGDARVSVELWVSLGSLLRSYTALHGLSWNRQAEIEQDAGRIFARQGDRWMELKRNGTSVNWKREDGSQGTLELTEAGRLLSSAGEEEMDMAAEGWARELMRESQK